MQTLRVGCLYATRTGKLAKILEVDPSKSYPVTAIVDGQKVKYDLHGNAMTSALTGDLRAFDIYFLSDRGGPNAGGYSGSSGVSP